MRVSARRLSVVVLAAALGIGLRAQLPSAADRKSDELLVAEVDRIATEKAAADSFSGVVVIAHSGTTLLQRAYGYADRQARILNTLDTRFNIASVGKMFTAAAIAKLVQDGKVAYDAPIGRYLPDFPISAAREKATVHHLLTHTSGIKGHLTAETIAAGPTRLEEYLRFLPKELAFEPGSSRAYSNGGYLVLGLIIERVSGENYFDFVTKRIFQPLAMTGTAFVDKTDRTQRNVSIGYTRSEGDSKAVRTWTDNNTLLLRKGDAAGGAFAPAGDLVKFLEAFRTGKLVAPEAASEMVTPKPGVVSGYGVGVLPFGSDTLVGMSGGTDGASADAYTYWNSGYTIVVLSNFDPPASHDIALGARRLLEPRFAK